MRVMVLVKATDASEKGFLPTVETVEMKNWHLSGKEGSTPEDGKRNRLGRAYKMLR